MCLCHSNYAFIDNPLRRDNQGTVTSALRHAGSAGRDAEHGDFFKWKAEFGYPPAPLHLVQFQKCTVDTDTSEERNREIM